MAEEDIEQARIADEVESRVSSKERGSALKALPLNTRLILGIGFAVVIWLLVTRSYTLTPFQNIMLVSVLGAALLWFISQDSTNRPRLLSEKELTAKAFEILRFKQFHPLGSHYQIVQGEIDLGLVGGYKMREGKPLFWERQVIIRPTSGLPVEYSMRQDPYKGTNMGIFLRPEGFDGSEIERPEEYIISKGFFGELRSEYEKDRYK